MHGIHPFQISLKNKNTDHHVVTRATSFEILLSGPLLSRCCGRLVHQLIVAHLAALHDESAAYELVLHALVKDDNSDDTSEHMLIAWHIMGVMIPVVRINMRLALLDLGASPLVGLQDASTRCLTL